MAQGKEHLLYKCKNLCSSLQCPCKWLAMAVHVFRTLTLWVRDEWVLIEKSVQMK